MFIKRFKREIKRASIKLIGSKDSIYSSSMGVAIGLFCSVAVPFLQFALAIIIAYFLKASKTLAVIFTFFSNPYTTPFLYVSACLLGASILRVDITIVEIKSSFKDIYSSFSFEAISHIGWKLFISYMVGGPIIGAALGLAGYFLSAKFIIVHQRNRIEKRKKRVSKNHI
ncbi:MAG TPA: hypothetical protein DD381_11035 [Lentisphaeria bacterium]|nr:MAG: hypothetical protein A2X47_00565 [Lentisphaerae bacterium GWF2_38_69]HBM16862.1 hypothetical protein [Lentisphaeria bacterium]